MCELKMHSAYSSYSGKNAEGGYILTHASSVTGQDTGNMLNCTLALKDPARSEINHFCSLHMDQKTISDHKELQEDMEV